MPKKGAPSGKCSVCASEHRARVDWLLASGQSARAVAAQFGLGYHGVWRHGRNHITDAYRRSVLLSAELSEEELRAQLAREGVSVVQQANAQWAGLHARWVLALEAGDDHRLAILSKEMTSLLRLRAQLQHELAPAGGTTVNVNNVVFAPGWLEGFGRDLMELGVRHPEVRAELRDLLRRRLGADPEPEPINVTPALEAPHG